jgi:hypothetical protein
MCLRVAVWFTSLVVGWITGLCARAGPYPATAVHLLLMCRVLMSKHRVNTPRSNPYKCHCSPKLCIRATGCCSSMYLLFWLNHACCR